MKKIPFVLLASSALLLLGSCGVTDTNAASSSSTAGASSTSSVSNSDTPVITSSNTSSEISSTSSAKTGFTITYNTDADHPDTTVKFYDSGMLDIANGGNAKIGSMIYVEIDDGTGTNSTIKGGHANSVALTAQTAWMYSFQMPEEDVIVTVDYVTKGVTTSHSLSYDTTSVHADTYISFGKSVDDIMNGKEIHSADAGDTIYVMTSTEEEISAIYANQIQCTAYAEYGWMLSSFTMPDEDVVITVDYKTVSTSISLTCADTIECTFYADTTTAISVMQGGAGSSISTANVGDSIVVYVYSETTVNHVYNGTGDSKTQLLGANDASMGDLTTYSIYALTVPSTGVYINID